MVGVAVVGDAVVGTAVVGIDVVGIAVVGDDVVGFEVVGSGVGAHDISSFVSCFVPDTYNAFTVIFNLRFLIPTAPEFEDNAVDSISVKFPKIN